MNNATLPESEEGGRRRRTSIACLNCRRRKRKCEWSETDQACQTCRDRGQQCVRVPVGMEDTGASSSHSTLLAPTITSSDSTQTSQQGAQFILHRDPRSPHYLHGQTTFQEGQPSDRPALGQYHGSAIEWSGMVPASQRSFPPVLQPVVSPAIHVDQSSRSTNAVHVAPQHMQPFPLQPYPSPTPQWHGLDGHEQHTAGQFLNGQTAHEYFPHPAYPTDHVTVGGNDFREPSGVPAPDTYNDQITSYASQEDAVVPEAEVRTRSAFHRNGYLDSFSIQD